jgi:membrane protease YdiL (CAAX protease family)
MMQGFTLVASAIVLDAILISIVYFRVVRPGIISWRDMGLTRAAIPRGWLPWVVGPPAMIAIVVAIRLALQQFGVQQTQLDGVQWVRSVPGWQFALIVFATAVLTPIAEELYFRGYVFRAYYAQKGPLQAYLFSSALFALVHFNLPAFLPIFAVGLFLAFLYQRTGSVLPGIVAHAFNNGMAFTALYFVTP